LVRTLALRPEYNIDPSHGLTLNFAEFSKWIKSKYSDSYRNTILCYSRKYYNLVTAENPRELDLLPATIKNNAIKSLIVLSKFLGNFKQFSQRLKSFDIKTTRPDSLNAFLRILNANNSDVMNWYNTTIPILKENERIFTKFLLHSGLRVDEAIHSFNMVIELSRENRINEYYDVELSCLCHFKYPQTFIRKTKNCFITFITPEFLGEIAHSETVTYSSIRKRLERNNTRMRFNELRDYFGTYLLQHGLLEQEVNLLQGRIPVSIFIRHYWSPKLKEISNRVFRSLETTSF
jgi:intergrase/recombinase